MNITGKVFKYGDNVDTDVIIPARYLNVPDHHALAKHCMEDLDPDFVKKVQVGDVIVARENFGCGSSREHAPIAIKASGISCVIATSFARIFYRNAINIGLPILECPDIYERVQAQDSLEINLHKGSIKNLSTGESFTAQPFPPFIMKIIQHDGLINTIRKGAM